VIVTGGASNIGRRLSLAFAEEGAHVWITISTSSKPSVSSAEGPSGRL
jgi:NAD(P)-dependent dehydrogenase (short-subunit alcohol dehydrogenase family)